MSWRAIAFICVFVLQIGALGEMIFRRVQLLADGRTVLLKCEPVDPRSFLSGDYVILNYEISRFSEKEMRALNRGGENFEEGQTVYLALKIGEKNPDGSGPFAAPAALSGDPRRLAEFDLYLRGTALDYYSPDDYDEGRTRVFEIRYGVEEYFVPQFEGLKIEGELARTHVEVAVSGTGESAIRRLFVKGREVRFY